MTAQLEATIISVRQESGIYSMWLEAGGLKAAPGQFVNVYLPDASRLLPRPISVCEVDARGLRLVFQAVGGGTELLAALGAGARLKILGGLGNGYEISPARRHVLAGGGIGIPPLIELAKQIRARYPAAGIDAFLAGRTAGFLKYLAADFEKAGAAIAFATDDGSLGFQGNIVELMKAKGAGGRIYACGPRPMLRAVAAYDENAQVSMEERMACGIGACVGCAVPMRGGAGFVRVCKDGPVFLGGEVSWDEC